jgi:hypothetical protein
MTIEILINFKKGKLYSLDDYGYFLSNRNAIMALTKNREVATFCIQKHSPKPNLVLSNVSKNQPNYRNFTNLIYTC